MSNLLFTGTEWTIDLIDKMWKTIDTLATEKYGLQYYPPQIEIVTSDQMLHYHSMNAMPMLYNHWSFGKRHAESEKAYIEGVSSIAYETIINTDPTIAYIMEDNSATMQALVLAHAVVGHGSFFKNNYLFQLWTDADAVLDELVYAKRFVARCEEEYGEETVERFLDACHALSLFGIDKYKRERKQSKEKMELKRLKWLRYEEESIDGFWDDMFTPDRQYVEPEETAKWPYPEENILYFIEKNAPHMPQWKREIVRIVRKQSQYFYPQIQTKLMNEGWASFWHYTLMNDLYDEGYINEGSFMEFLHSHCAVCRQVGIDDVYESIPQHLGWVIPMDQLPPINPYALGFAMFMDIKRACENPTEEDYEYLPLCAGKPWLETMKWIMSSFKDEGFILEFLGPRVIEKFKMFCIEDDEDNPDYTVINIQDKEDYRQIRKHLSKQYSFTEMLPQIEITGFAYKGERTLQVTYHESRGRRLHEDMLLATNKHLIKLWGYPIEFVIRDEDGKILSTKKRTHL